MTYLYYPRGANQSEISIGNSSTTNLASSATFTGSWEKVSNYPGVVLAAKSDQDGTLYADFSADGVTTHSTLTYSVTANINEVHKLTITRDYFRIRFTNTGSSTTTALTIQTTYGSHQQLSSPLNLSVQQDADAIVVRSVDSEMLIAEGLLSGYSITNKFGTNSDIDTGSVPEDIWEGGGAYMGWATSAETIEVFSSDVNDTSAGTGARTIRIVGLDANYDVQSETVTLNGTTPVTTTNTFIRAHTATTQSAGSGGVNAGTITFRQSTTTTNIFLSMVIGRNQTNAAVYTVPAGYTAYMRNLHVAIRSNTSAQIDGAIWTRSFGNPFRTRRPFTVTTNFRLYDQIFGGLVFSEKSDITLRILTCSANNTPVNGGFDLILVKN